MGKYEPKYIGHGEVIPKKSSQGRIIGKIIAYLILTIFALIFIFPFVYAFIVSVTTSENFYDFKWIPDPFTFENYVQFFKENDIVMAFVRTMLYIAAPVFVGTFSAALAGYATARIDFKGHNVVFFCLLAVTVIPGVITLMPSYVMFNSPVYSWGLPLFPLIVPGIFGGCGTMFFLHQYFKTLPRELEEAAEIDGMRKFGIFMKIILPLSTPAIITQIILGINACYNDFLNPLLYVGTQENYFTVQLLLYFLGSGSIKNYPLLMAGSIVAMLPSLILYIFAQRFFTEGIVMTGIKG